MEDGSGAISECVRCVLPSLEFVRDGRGEAAAVEAEREPDAVQHAHRGAEVLEF